MESSGILQKVRNLKSDKEQILRKELSRAADYTRQTKYHNFAMFCPPPTDPIKKLIQLSIFCEKSDKEQILISWGSLCLLRQFFLSNCLILHHISNLHFAVNYTAITSTHISNQNLNPNVLYNHKIF